MPASVGEDARGRKVKVGTTVLDKRGRIFSILETEKKYRRQDMARALGPEGRCFITLSRVFRIEPSIAFDKTSKDWWQRYNKFVKPLRKKARARRRRAEASHKFWPCPVCISGSQPIRFKIGVRVWDGKRLRVCATPCKRRVLREVRHSAHADARRRVAWKYMRRGGQL